MSTQDAQRSDGLAGPTMVVAQQLDAPAAEVYAMWLDRDRLATWWWPAIPDTTYAVEPSVGGTFQVASEVADLGASGRFLELVEPERIEMTWRWETGEGQEEDDHLTIELREHSHGTLLVLTHRVADPEGDTDMREGWVGALTSLASKVKTGS